MNLQAYEYFLKGSTEITWIWNPNLDSSLEFKTWHNLSKFPCLTRFKHDSNLIWIWIWILFKNLMEKDKSYYSFKSHYSPLPQW
jgi:hypothetical protein